MITRSRLLSTPARSLALAAVAVVALTSFASAPASAAPQDGVNHAATEFSSQHRRHYSRGGNAAALAAFGAIAGTAAAIASSRSGPDYYYDEGPTYYGGGPAYYGGYGGPGYGSYGSYRGGASSFGGQYYNGGQ
jgi:hypothetical protein